MRVLFAIVLALTFVAPAQAVQFAPEFYTGHEVGTEPALYESYDEAAAYWAQVPGVPSVVDACGPPPQIFSVAHSPLLFNGYGYTRHENGPCRIWIEEDYLARTAAMTPNSRDLDRCRFVIHEYGHTLGLDHKDYGDQAHVMVSGIIPDICLAAYPSPVVLPSPQPIRWERTVCVPGWAYYAPERIANTYMSSHRYEARRMFKQWAKRYRKDARRVRGKAAVCLPAWAAL